MRLATAQLQSYGTPSPQRLVRAFGGATGFGGSATAVSVCKSLLNQVPFGAGNFLEGACETSVDNAIAIAGSLPSSVLPPGVSQFTQLIEAISPIVNLADRGLKALPEALTWLGMLAQQVAPLFDPSTSLQTKAQVGEQIWGLSNPKNSPSYHLFMDPQYQDLADLLAIYLFSPLALMESMGAGVGQAVLFANLMDKPTPYLQLIRACISILITGPTMTSTQLVQAVASLGTEAIQTVTGIQVSLTTAFLVGGLIVTNLPQPPYSTIIEHILADPTFQKNLEKKGLSKTVATKLIPAGVKCFEMSDADSFLLCAQKVTDAIFPGVVKNLSRHGVSLTDVRMVVSALMYSDGDIVTAFDEDLNPGALEALVALGVVGIAALTEQFAPGTPVGQWLASGPLGTFYASDIGKQIWKAVHYFDLLSACYGDSRDLQARVSDPVGPGGTDLSAPLSDLSEARWNLQQGFALMKARGRFTGFLTQKNGKWGVTAPFQTLLQTLAADVELAPIASAFCDVFPLAGVQYAGCTGYAAVPAAAAASAAAGPSILSPAGFATLFAPTTDPQSKTNAAGGMMMAAAAALLLL